MPGKADLHIHTTASDGSMPPEQIVSVALKLGLRTIAITDHDTIAGISAAHESAKTTTITIMNGVEITTIFNHREVHMLAYDFDIEDLNLNELLLEHKKARYKRAKAIIHQLQKKGLDLNIDEAMAETSTNNVCRPHIAAVLVNKGYVATSKEAFLRYLSDEAIDDLEDFYYPLNEVIEVVKRAGGVSIIAHPGRLYSDVELDEMVQMGIDGIEIVHPSHSHPIQQHLDEFAKKHNLLKTGGSDFHGKEKQYYNRFGIFGITLEEVEKIERIAKHRKQVAV